MGARAVSFLLIPIYTAYIAPPEWGILNILMISGDLAALLVLCQMPTALYRFWALTDSETEKQHLAGLSVSFTFILSIIIFLPLYIWAEPCATKLLRVEGLGNYLRVLLLTEQLAILSNVIQSEMRLRDEAKVYAILDIVQNFGIAACSIFFVVVLEMGIYGILIGQLLAFFIIVSSIFPRFIRRVELNLDWKLLKKLIGFSLPLIPSALALVAIHNIDRLFIQAILEPAAVGLYSIGYKFGTIVNILVLGPFLLIWEPKSYDLALRDDSSVKFGQVFTYCTALLLFVVVGLTGAAKEVVQIMTSPSYHAAWKVVPLVALSYLFFGMDAIVKVGLLVNNCTKTILNVVLFSCAVNIIGNMVLIPILGIIGAALATLAAFLFLFSIDTFLSQRYLPITWQWGRLCKLIFAGTLVLLGMLSIDTLPLWPKVALKALILLSYPALLLIVRFFDKNEISLAIHFWTSLKDKARTLSS